MQGLEQLMATGIKFLVAVGALAFAGSASAITCGGPSGTRTVTVNPAAACTDSGLGNLGDGDAAAVVGGSVIDRDAANSNGGALNITGVGGDSGTWSLGSALWSTYSTMYLYFHFGNGNPADPTFNPDWFVVQLTSGSTGGTWSVNPTQLTLSNIGLLGVRGPGGGGGGTPVSEPGALALLGLSLGIAGWMSRRRRAT
jgi:hypothetical protein